MGYYVLWILLILFLVGFGYVIGKTISTAIEISDTIKGMNEDPFEDEDYDCCKRHECPTCIKDCSKYNH